MSKLRKDSTLTIRINSDLKRLFFEACDSEFTTPTEALTEEIRTFVIINHKVRNDPLPEKEMKLLDRMLLTDSNVVDFPKKRG